MYIVVFSFTSDQPILYSIPLPFAGASIFLFNIPKLAGLHTVQEKKDDFSGDIIIKGKADSLNPLEYHNIINGDTIQSISIKGNADYQINNHFQKTDNNKTESGKEESLNVIQKAARDMVSKETIKDVASTVETKAKEITEKGFTSGVWFTVIIIGISALVLLFLYIWLRKTTWFKNKFK